MKTPWGYHEGLIKMTWELMHTNTVTSAWILTRKTACFIQTLYDMLGIYTPDRMGSPRAAFMGS